MTTGSRTGTTGDASETSLPAWMYTDQAFFERERRTIFRTAWQVVCHLNDVPRPATTRRWTSWASRC
jgi:phenylpropionate dioxygenase-like ring-hydroxylating dioxygenase large terminal subunit